LAQTLHTLRQRLQQATLKKNAAVYIIREPDTDKEIAKPNYVQPQGTELIR